MSKFLTLGAMLLALSIFGCGPEEKSKSVQDSKETTTEKVTETADSAAGEVKEMATAVGDKAVEMKDKAGPAIKEAAADTKEMAVAAADKTGEAVKQAVSPETIVLEASYGNVTFPHEVHSAAFDCNACHGEGTPGLFGLDKDKAHALCKDCHKQQGAGPTGCKDCHKK